MRARRAFSTSFVTEPSAATTGPSFQMYMALVVMRPLA